MLSCLKPEDHSGGSIAAGQAGRRKIKRGPYLLSSTSIITWQRWTRQGNASICNIHPLMVNNHASNPCRGGGGGSLFLWNGLIGRYQQSVEFQSHYVNQKQARIWLHKITDRLTNNPGFLSALDARIHLHLGRKPQCRSIFFDVRDDAACYFVIISCGKRLSTHCPH